MYLKFVLGVVAVAMVAALISFNWRSISRRSRPRVQTASSFVPNELARPSTNPGLGAPQNASRLNYQPRKIVDSSGYGWVITTVKPWAKNASLSEIAERFRGAVANAIQSMDEILLNPKNSEDYKSQVKYTRASFRNFEGDPIGAYDDLCAVRKYLEKAPVVAQEYLYSTIYFQGISALRRGENENCILCRGETSCILPIANAAIHKQQDGSRLAIKHFKEYLAEFPDDLEVRWLMNVAYMTLGEHPEHVPKEQLIELDRYNNNEFNIGKFRDIGDRIGVNRLNQAGGAIMEDIDNDGRLDIVVSNFDPTGPMAVYWNNGQGSFENITEQAGVGEQLGGLNCVQTDFNNDGFADIFIMRGAWLNADMAMRPSLLRNNKNRTFTDVTVEAGLDTPVNSIAATWADYDNDGWLDVFVCCERQPNRLYHNLQNGKFEEVAQQAGLAGNGKFQCKGANWIDFNNDGLQDIFLNHFSSVGGQLFQNLGQGTFQRVSDELGVSGPILGFSCWTWDFDNDGFQDIFATSYDKDVGDCVKGMLGESHSRNRNVLYRNLNGRGFEDVTTKAGLDVVLITMGSNFGDFDNDGFLDMYLGTGDPSLGSLVPNRMFKNVGGKRFSDITSSSGTGNLQKGHGVACGDWDADGNVDVFIEMGGAVSGDKYHNILFQNPGHENNWVNVKLVGQKTNKLAIGARLKLVTNGPSPQTIFRHISSGSSFGGNPMEQLIGIGNATSIDTLEIEWPTSKTKQIFHHVPIGRFIEITEFVDEVKILERQRIPFSSSSPTE